MHPFAHDFYGHDMSVLILGYIRPELDYVSKGESETRCPCLQYQQERGGMRFYAVA